MLKTYGTIKYNCRPIDIDVLPKFRRAHTMPIGLNQGRPSPLSQ